MKNEIPVRDKLALTLEEASAYTNIGINKLREVADNNISLVLMVGNKRLIKRKELEKFIDEASTI